MAVNEGCGMNVANDLDKTLSNACDFVLVIITSTDYINNLDTPKCQPTVDFGIGFCVPDNTTKKIYEALNDMRAFAFTKYRPLL